MPVAEVPERRRVAVGQPAFRPTAVELVDVELAGGNDLIDEQPQRGLADAGPGRQGREVKLQIAGRRYRSFLHEQ